MAAPNTFYHGDNLDILRQFPAECVDLITLDPPFSSSHTYGVLFKDESQREADEPIRTFEDVWHWGPAAEAAYQELAAGGPAAAVMAALREVIGQNQMMAFLVMMALRLVELRRVLKPSGSLYLHCDPTANHYIKLVLDAIFGAEGFIDEIVWSYAPGRGGAHPGTLHIKRAHDVILFYARPEHRRSPAYHEIDAETAAQRFPYVEKGTGRRYRAVSMAASGTGQGDPPFEVLGVTRSWRYSRAQVQQFLKEGRIHQVRPGAVPQLKQYLDEVQGQPLQDVWGDLLPVGAEESPGYPTQKPLALLERIIATSSSPGEIVLDPFCGGGTAILAAQKLGRRWIGIDVSHLSTALVKVRLRDLFGLEAGQDYAISGEPQDLVEARQLAQEDPVQFRAWALSLAGARPWFGAKPGKKGGLKAIDGLIPFTDEPGGNLKSVLVQVKSDPLKSADVRDLKRSLDREQAALGLLIALEDPAPALADEAASAGAYHSPGWNRDYPRLQLLAVADLLGGQSAVLPPRSLPQMEQAKTPDQAPEPKTLEMFPDE